MEGGRPILRLWAQCVFGEGPWGLDWVLGLVEEEDRLFLKLYIKICKCLEIIKIRKKRLAQFQT